MIIFIHGPNTFLTERKLSELTEKYRQKHKSGLNIFIFSQDSFSFDKFKDAIEAVSMFGEKKLIILKNTLTSSDASEKLFEYFKEKKLKTDGDAVLIITEEKIPEKENKDFLWLQKEPSIVQESKHFTGSRLKKWIEEEAGRYGAKINDKAILLVMTSCKDDIWRISNEIAKLASYSKNISEEDVGVLVARNIESDIFKAIEYLAEKNKKEAVDIFYKQVASGNGAQYIISMMNFQFRNLIKVKELADSGRPPVQIAKMAKMHPFVVQKTLKHISRYQMSELKEIYRNLLELDIKTKTSNIDPALAIDNFILQV